MDTFKIIFLFLFRLRKLEIDLLLNFNESLKYDFESVF